MTADVIANTIYGKIKGEYIDGIYRFLGIRYAASPEGKNRFLPPQPLDPWNTVQTTKSYVSKCWQTDTPRIEEPEIANSKYNRSNQILMTGNMELGKGEQTENCLAINLWTPALHKGEKLPVMVWCHGGGNVAGTGEAPWHDGWNMAKKNNVVMISFNHRLTLFGYLYLANLGDKRYEQAVNVGHLDMVAVLQWVRDNIENFGGDPDNVTIFGESGGGGKVAALLGMPAAKGLFHRAIIQSGGFYVATPEEGAKQAKVFLDHLGVDASNLDKLQGYTPQELIQAMRDINATRDPGNYLNFPVVLDGEVVKYNPFDGAEGSEFCKDIPLICCYTKEDSALQALFNPAVFTYTFEELPEKIQELGYSPELAEKIITSYKNILPEDATACDIYVALLNDTSHRKLVETIGASKNGLNGAPFYSCVFCFESPDKEQKAIHGVDVPFFFDNAIFAPGLYTAENKHDAMHLSEVAGATWAAFARNGNPNNDLIPEWKPYDLTNRYMMLINTKWNLVNDYHSNGRKIAFGLEF